MVRKLNSLSELSKNGGQYYFDKEIMFEWSKDREVDLEEIRSITQYSLKFLPIEKNSANSFVEIYGDDKHFDDCTDVTIISMILKLKPVKIFTYSDNETVSFFEFKTYDNKNIVVSCDSVADRPCWFYNVELEDVTEIFENPVKIK